MFGLGGWEIAILGLAALVFFGPHKLPQLMKQAGKVMREVRKASYEFQHSLERELEDDEYRRAHRRERKRKAKAAQLGVPPEALGAKPADAPEGAVANGGGGNAAANGGGTAVAAGPGAAAMPSAAEPVTTPSPAEPPADEKSNAG